MAFTKTVFVFVRRLHSIFHSSQDISSAVWTSIKTWKKKSIEVIASQLIRLMTTNSCNLDKMIFIIKSKSKPTANQYSCLCMPKITATVPRLDIHTVCNFYNLYKLVFSLFIFFFKATWSVALGVWKLSASYLAFYLPPNNTLIKQRKRAKATCLFF